MSIADKIRQNRERYQRELAEIQRDPDLTAEAKARRIEPLYREAKALDSKLRGERMSELRTKVRAAEKEAFAAPALRGADPALLQLNYRNALDGVGEITDARILSSRLERAVITGDKSLARAVAWRANHLGADGVVRAYLDSDEDANRKWSNWAEAYAEVEQIERLGESLGFGDVPISEPPELRGFREAS
jgi:beta-phosphoglucomutase-like phosphatase (HAD superfamily)